MHSSRSYLPSPRMYSAVVPGLPSPTLPPSSAAGALPVHQRGSSDHSPKSAAYSESYRDAAAGGAPNVAAVIAQAYSRSTQSETAKGHTAASLAYARMQQEGFPYGISGVPHMPSYNYGSELYNYVSNGFPRKSRICSYCAKVFTRSTTRRYHEKRCPLLRAAGSLMKGTVGANSTSAINGPSTESADVSNGGEMQPRPLPANSGANKSPPPPSLLASTSTSYTSSSSPATSVGMPTMARSHHALNSSNFYSLYRSQPPILTTTSTSCSALTSHPALPASATAASASQSNLDQNRNSVLSSVKPEGEQKTGVPTGSDGRAELVSRESDLLRNTTLGSQGEEPTQGQQPLFSPLSIATSLSPSGSRTDEEEGESDDRENVSLKPPTGASVKGDGNTYVNDPAIRQYYLKKLASLHAAQAVTKESGTPYLPTAYVVGVGNSSGKGAMQPTPETQCASSDREEDSFRDGDSSYRDEEDADGFSHAQAAMEAEEADSPEEDKKCGICNEEFGQTDDLRVHERKHQKYKPNSCRYCGQRFIKPSMRIAHQRLHTGRYSLGCVVCGLHVLTKFGLRQHVHREHFNPVAGETHCRFCETTISSVHGLRRHFLSHRHLIPLSERESIQYLRVPRPVMSVSPVEPEEEASQELPPPSIDSKTSQDSPVETGSEPPPLLGPITALPPPAEERMNGSGKSCGSREKEWCRICEKDYPKSFMRYHEREHADQKPYECSLCKKRFGYKNNMKSHMKLHAGIKPYQCNICLAKFTRGSTLRRHSRRHGLNGDSIWDLFVKKSSGSLSDRAMLLNQAAAQDAALAAGPKGQVQRQGSPPIAGSRAMKADPALMACMGKGDVTATGKSYDLRGYSPSSSAPQPMFNTYAAMPAAVPQAMFQPYVAPQQYLGYGANYSSTASTAPPLPQQQAVQSDALDFSMPEKHRRRNSSSSSASAQRPPSVSRQSPGSSYPPISSGMEGFKSFANHADQREMMEEEHEERRHPAPLNESSAYHPANRHSLADISLNYRKMDHEAFHHSEAHDFGSQVTLCCAHPLSHGNEACPQSRRGNVNCSPLDMSNPTKSVSRLEGLQHESIATLMSAGRLFRCPHCDCYFTDYTMYHLHQKIHLPNQPFVCFICLEDCLDRMGFTEHLLHHLR